MDWRSEEISSLCLEFTDGNWIETKDQSDSGIRLVQTGNVGEGEFKDRRDKARWISEGTFRRLKCFEVLPGDCLVSRLPDPVGRACAIPETGDKMITAVDCTVIRVDEDRLNRDFFLYFSLSKDYLRDVDDRCTGTTRRRISRKNLGKVPIPLPPLEEQKRIVAVLDAAFEGLARARTHIESNLQNVQELFEGFVGTYFESQTAIDRGYRIAPLSSVAKLSYGFTEKAVMEPVGPKFLRITDIQDGHVDWETVPHCRIPEDIKEKYLLKTGDIVFARTGATTGKSYLIGEVTDAIYASYLIRLQTISDELNPEFLSFYFQSAKYWDDVRAGTEGAAQGGFNASKLGAMAIPIPPMSYQLEIVGLLKNQAHKNEELKSSYTAKLQDIDDLRQSLLKKAFAGELI
ncbi:restriction endonuclease subunit S [Cognatiyoonia sp. IB215182]|uniref:restriction endonuclease subunit S n=1 Tax=Cognatiyoonia sp. IB215182 TaxID=3097353 RepID=UPI002A241A46|nr:restriction endonuclease subunit S [Cognatiyoonia sp. IB215182]